MDLTVWRNDLTMMDLLISHGGISTAHPLSFEALHLLLNHNHSPNTYIEQECKCRNTRNIKLLIDHGADLDLVSMYTDDMEILDYITPSIKEPQ